jgi:hypothetical protein
MSLKSSGKFFTKSFSIANLIGDAAGKSSLTDHEDGIEVGMIS